MKRITNPAELAQYRAQYVSIHTGADRPAQKHVCKVGDAIAYTWQDPKFGPRAVVWLGASQNPYSGRQTAGAAYWFKTEDRRAAFIRSAFETAASIAKRSAERKAAKQTLRAAGHKLNVGDVLRCSWGYDQTNIDYFQVTARIGDRMVEIRAISQQSEGDGYGGNSRCVPAPGQFIGEPMRKLVSDAGDSVRIHSFASAYKIEPIASVGPLKVYADSYWSADH